VSTLLVAIPGSVLILVTVGAIEIVLRRKGRRRGATLSGTYVDEFTAVFYGTKRTELEHRDSQTMMRDEDAEGAPPFGVDLDRGTVVLPPPGQANGGKPPGLPC
jgi:hypothetical protein